MAIKNADIDTIFVDCFDTIIFRNIKRKAVFQEWAKELANKYNMPWKKIYKAYNSTNWRLCCKKLFTTFTLQERFGVVLAQTKDKLAKIYPEVNWSDFVDTAMDMYFQKELDCYCVNQDMLTFLRESKDAGKKIYLVSDFYCQSDMIRQWFKSLHIAEIFDDIFSSGDYDKEKATTKLYRHLLRQLSLNPNNVIMYGDNLWSDVMMARVCGLNAKRIKSKQQRKKYAKEKDNN